MASSALRGALGLVCAAGFCISAAVLLDRTLTTPPGRLDERRLHRVLRALHVAVAAPEDLTVTARAGRVLVSGQAAPGDEARIVEVLRGMGVHAMQLSIKSSA